MVSDRFTLGQLNRTGLARQLLLERAQLRASAALERVAMLPSQDLPAPFIDLWTRLAGFQREDGEAPGASARTGAPVAG